MENKSLLKTYKTPVELYNKLKPSEKEWQQLTTYAAKDTINLNAVSAKVKAGLLSRIQSMLARQVWRTEP